MFVKLFRLHCDGGGLIDSGAISKVSSIFNEKLFDAFETYNHQLVKRNDL